MEKYNYLRAITNDVKDWIREETNFEEDEVLDRDKLCIALWDELFALDAITGNGIYYYDTEEMCSSYLCGNYNLIYEAMAEFCADDEINILIKHYENQELARYFDCIIRCYLLTDAIYQAIDELAAEGFLKI